MRPRDASRSHRGLPQGLCGLPRLPRLGCLGWIFRKVPKGGRGVIFNPKIYVAYFGNFNHGLLIMELIRNSNFRVQGMFFSTIVLRKIKTRHTLKKALLNPYIYYLAIIPPRIHAIISVIKNLQYNFPKMR